MRISDWSSDVCSSDLRYFRQKGYIDLDEAVLYDFQQSNLKLSDEQMAMLIGSVFRFSAADITFPSDLINRRGLITPPEYPIQEGTRLEPFFKRALLCSFHCFLPDKIGTASCGERVCPYV